MSLEVATYINGLVTTNPVATDKKNQGDDHLRLLKTVMQNTLPNATKPYYFPDITTKGANYSILASDQNKMIFADPSAGSFNLSLPTTLVGADAGWEVRVAKAIVVNPVFVLPGAATLFSAQSTVAKIRVDVPFAFHHFLWSGSSWVHSVHGVLEPGRIALYLGASIPIGYALVSGNSLLRTELPETFAHWGTTWGAVDGTHFTIPNVLDKFPVFAGSGYALGATGGEAAHTLVAAELAAHNHRVAGNTGVESVPHTHAQDAATMKSSGGAGALAGAPNTLSSGGTTGPESAQHVHPFDVNSDNTGSNVAHENRPPYLGIYPIYRVC